MQFLSLLGCDIFKGLWHIPTYTSVHLLFEPWVFTELAGMNISEAEQNFVYGSLV